MATKDDRIAELEAENARLKAELAAASTAPVTKPTRPRFLLCEGTRDELDRHGKARDPWTGELLERAVELMERTV
jgi:hypothetical protein